MRDLQLHGGQAQSSGGAGRTLLESVKVMLAATASPAQGRRTCSLDALTDAMPAYDGRYLLQELRAAAGRLCTDILRKQRPALARTLLFFCTQRLCFDDLPTLWDDMQISF